MGWPTNFQCRFRVVYKVVSKIGTYFGKKGWDKNLEPQECGQLFSGHSRFKSMLIIIIEKLCRQVCDLIFHASECILIIFYGGAGQVDLNARPSWFCIFFLLASRSMRIYYIYMTNTSKGEWLEALYSEQDDHNSFWDLVGNIIMIITPLLKALTRWSW